jgi:hypothetical protein
MSSRTIQISQLTARLEQMPQSRRPTGPCRGSCAQTSFEGQLESLVDLNPSNLISLFHRRSTMEPVAKLSINAIIQLLKQLVVIPDSIQGT